MKAGEIRCPHCRKPIALNASPVDTDREKLARLAIYVRRPVNAIAGPQTTPPRGVR